MKIIWRKRAERAYLEQIAYVRERHRKAAERLQAAVDHRLALLGRHPEMGRPSRRQGVRELVISDTPYVAVYQIADDAIIVLQFFHTRQNR